MITTLAEDAVQKNPDGSIRSIHDQQWSGPDSQENRQQFEKAVAEGLVYGNDGEAVADATDGL